MAVQETELERIERELDILRTRRGLYMKWGGPKTIYIVVVAAAVVTILLAVLAAQTVNDTFMGLFIAAMVFVIGGLIWLASGVVSETTTLPNPDRLRRVNIVRSSQRPGGLVPLYKSFAHPNSIIDEIDEMIAWRERRLAELNGVQS